MESCTLLVLGSQYGIQILDWNGAVLIHEMDFAQHGIGGDEKQVRGLKQELKERPYRLNA